MHHTSYMFRQASSIVLNILRSLEVQFHFCAKAYYLVVLIGLANLL